MEIACLSDMGRARENNEDSCCCTHLENGWELLIVADGMGGHNAGEVASKIAVKSITDYIKAVIKDNITNDAYTRMIEESIQKANNDIYNESLSDPSYSGMGTTVTAALISGNKVLIGHVGDSRAYILKNESLHKITSDHSLVAELVKKGIITEDEAMHHPQKNIMTRALGTFEDVEVDIERADVNPGDIILLCSDGLTNMLCDKEIETILLSNDSANTVAKEMVDKANDEGGYDNITVIIARITLTDGEVRQ